MTRNSALPIFASMVVGFVPEMTLATIMIESKKDLSIVNNNRPIPFFPYEISANRFVIVGEAAINDSTRAFLWADPGCMTNIAINHCLPFSMAYAAAVTGSFPLDI